MNNIKKDIDLIWEVNSADIDALQDAQFTLEAIKEADPGTHDEIIDASLRLISKALNLSCHEAIVRISDQLGVQT